MAQTSAGGSVLILALLNAWLAARCGRSSLGWFLGSIVFAPIVWLFTLYLVTRPRVAADTSTSPWGWIAVAVFVLAVLLAAYAVLLAR